jgi:hypothetical protein
MELNTMSSTSISVLRHLEGRIVHPVCLGVITLRVHLIDFGSHHLLEERRELFNLLLVLLSANHVDRPSSIELLHQVQTFWVVDPVLIPAVDKLILEQGCLLGLDAALSLEVSPDEFGDDHALWWNSHF